MCKGSKAVCLSPIDCAYSREKTLFCIVNYIIHKVKFEIRNKMGDRMDKMLETG